MYPTQGPNVSKDIGFQVNNNKPAFYEQLPSFRVAMFKVYFVT